MKKRNIYLSLHKYMSFKKQGQNKEDEVEIEKVLFYLAQYEVNLVLQKLLNSKRKITHLKRKAAQIHTFLGKDLTKIKQ